MRSHLTRNVFRQILANEPIVHRRCLRLQTRRSISSRPHHRPLLPNQGFLSITRYQQRRGIFNFNIFSKRQETREADMEPGIDKMMELAKRERMRARMPPPEDVVFAFKQLFESKDRRQQILTDTEAQLALQSLRYLLKLRDGPGQQSASAEHLPSVYSCRKAMNVLWRSESSLSEAHVDLARHLYEDLAIPGTSLRRQALMVYVQVLCRTGQTSHARDLVLQFEQSGPPISPESVAVEEQDQLDLEESTGAKDDVATDSRSTRPLNGAWHAMLNGFAREDDDAQFQSTLAVITERRRVNRKVCESIIDFHLKHNNIEEAERAWKAFQRAGLSVAPEDVDAHYGAVLRKILLWCLANNQLAMGHEIVRDIMTSNPAKPSWDAVFIWAAGTKKSADEIDRMMTVMEKSNANISERSEWRIPDIGTINSLVEFAISIKDPYMAERFIALGRDRKIEPDARTLVLQMDYRLSVGDVDGALIAYKNLQSMDTSSNEDLPTVNRLIVALCQTSRHDFDTIMNVTADLSDRRARFESPTVSALSILHLNRAEPDDVIDLLNTHAFHYSSQERKAIRDTILGFALAPKVPTPNAWQAYTILRTVFDELPRPERTSLLSSFLQRERADMAVSVFQAMRTHTRADTLPTTETYVTAFLGLAKLRDVESLEVVHNLLKLDYNINISTYLRNALIVAYTACGKPRNALSFWDEIVASREGPTYNSIVAALRACEKAHWGDVRARQIWTMLRERDVDLDQNLWAAYIAALAGNGDVENAIETLEIAVEKGEVEVDVFMLGSLYAATSRSVRQGEVGEWARGKYPRTWAALEDLGTEEDEEGGMMFRIERAVGP